MERQLNVVMEEVTLKESKEKFDVLLGVTMQCEMVSAGGFFSCEAEDKAGRLGPP